MTTVLPRLWIITDPKHPDGPVAPIAAAFRAALPQKVGVLLRAKQATDRERMQWAKELRALTRKTNSALIIHGRPDIARIVEADGVHLAEHGLSIAQARRLMARSAICGVSRHDRQGLQAAQAEGATYAFLSPVFEVPGKAPPLGVAGVADTIAELTIPVFALGGVTPSAVRPLLQAGAYGIAVQRAIHGDANVAAALRRFTEILDKCGSRVE